MISPKKYFSMVCFMVFYLHTQKNIIFTPFLIPSPPFSSPIFLPFQAQQILSITHQIIHSQQWYSHIIRVLSLRLFGDLLLFSCSSSSPFSLTHFPAGNGKEGDKKGEKGESVVEWLVFLASLYWYPCIRREKEQEHHQQQQERDRVKELSIYSQFSLASEATRILIILSRLEGEKNDMKQWAVSEISRFLKFEVEKEVVEEGEEEGEGEGKDVVMAKEEIVEEGEGEDVGMEEEEEERKKKKRESREKERERGRFLKKVGERERGKARDRAGWLTGLAIVGGGDARFLIYFFFFFFSFCFRILHSIFDLFVFILLF